MLSLLDARRCVVAALSVCASLPSAAQAAATLAGGFDVSVTRGTEARVVDAGLGPDMALFYFESPDNPEVLVHVLDGCAVNSYRWAVVSAATDLPIRVVIVDHHDGHAWVAEFDDGHSSRSLVDMRAFRCATSQAGTVSQGVAAELEYIATGATLHGRFEWEVVATHEGDDYVGQYVDLPGDNAGLFYFFSRSYPEVLFRVQDGRAINGQWWFFLAAATQLELTVSVQDTVTGDTHTYIVPAGHLGGIADYRGTKPSDPDPRPEPEPDPEPTPDCSDRTCLLQDGRFRVKVWYLLAGDAKSRSANAVEVDLGEPAGLFTFDSGEPELLVRISDQCNWSDHYAVYAAAGTDAVSYSVAVRDTTTNELRWFRARHGEVITDSVAFPCN